LILYQTVAVVAYLIGGVMLQTSVCVVLAYSLAYSLWAAHSFFPVTYSATAAAVTAYGAI